MTGATSEMMALRDPDIRLMLLVRDANDQAAFAELVSRFQHRLVGVMNHLVGNTDEAEDLAQEVFLRVYRTRERYTPKAKFSTWLFTIANNLALNSLRDRQRRPHQSLLVGGESGPLGPRPQENLENKKAVPPTQNIQMQEMAGIVRRALDELNERQRMAVVLNKFEDMGYAEIADVMGLTSKAVKSLLSRARGKLRDALQGYIYMDGESPPKAGDDSDEE
ncbi:sigma-70 family RNA polymerase sigma factor [soil metagenome]